MNLGIRNVGDFLNHSIAEEGMGLVDVSSLPPPHTQSSIKSISLRVLNLYPFLATAKSTVWSFELHPYKEPLWMHNYPPILSGKYCYHWVTAEPSFEPTAGRRHGRHQTTSWPPSFSLQKVSRDILLPVILSRGISAWKCLLPTHQ